MILVLNPSVSALSRARADGEDPSSPARMWLHPDLPGRIGFVSTMTHKFCSTCNRVRVTANGWVPRCLFAGTLLDLRSMLRSGVGDENILSELTAYWSGKPVGHRLDSTSFLGCRDNDRGGRVRLAATSHKTERTIEYP